MIHVTDEKRYPFGIEFTSPVDSDFNIVDAGDNKLEISLRQPPAIKTYSKLPMDDDEGLVLYQELLQNSTDFPPHRYPPSERAKVNVFREVEKMAPQQLEYLTGTKIGTCFSITFSVKATDFIFNFRILPYALSEVLQSESQRCCSQARENGSWIKCYVILSGIPYVFAT